MHLVLPRMVRPQEDVNGAPGRSASRMGQCALGARTWVGPSVPSLKDVPTPISTARVRIYFKKKGYHLHLIQLALSRDPHWISWESGSLLVYVYAVVAEI
jgi:hypothetical protein